MPLTGEHVDVERKPKLGGGGPGKIPHRHGFGGGGDDGDHDRSRDPSTRENRLRRYRVGMVLCIISVSTLFVCLVIAHLMFPNTGKWDPVLKHGVLAWRPLVLPYPQLIINSLILAFSSLTLELARRRMNKDAEFYVMGIQPPETGRNAPWLWLTVLLGFGFLGGQVFVWNILRAQGLFLRSNPSSSFFYVITGLHAVHLAGGLIALLYAAGGGPLGVRFEKRQLDVEVTGWYWHFMGILWLGIFALLHFAKG